MSIQANVESLREELPADGHVRLIAVSKYASVPQMIEAYEAGIRDFGENKIQDVDEKQKQIPPEIFQEIRWHFLGHLQKNKVKKTLFNRFWLIHSIDSLALAQQLSRLNLEAGQIQPVLLQLNLTREPQKTGFLEEDLLRDYPLLLSQKGLLIQGLMTIGPHTDDVPQIKGTFCALKDFRDKLVEAFGHPLPELSMGMSQDFHHGIECGATMVRLGTRIFGPSSVFKS